MTLRELLGDGPDVVVTGLTFDNRLVAPGTLFFCVPGFTRDGHDFAPDAVARGAVALVVAAAAGARRARGAGRRTCAPRWRSPRRASTAIRRRRCGSPASPGTNGKTTTAFLTRALLEGAGLRRGLLGTVKSVVGGEERAVVRTTPEAFDLQRTFREMLDAGDVACAMEISSHALELKRADGDPRRRGGVHQPHAGPPRLPSDDGGLLPGQAAAVRLGADRGADRQRRRRATGGG